MELLVKNMQHQREILQLNNMTLSGHPKGCPFPLNSSLHVKVSHAQLSRIGCGSLLTGRHIRAKMYTENAATTSNFVASGRHGLHVCEHSIQGYEQHYITFI